MRPWFAHANTRGSKRNIYCSRLREAHLTYRPGIGRLEESLPSMENRGMQ
jgi:hypothetical protein